MTARHRHYAEAERLLGMARDLVDRDDRAPNLTESMAAGVWVNMAQAHATLATCAAKVADKAEGFG